MSSTSTEIPTLSPAERTAALERYILWTAKQGWRVQSQTPTSAQLLKGKPTNHLLHLILSIVTLGAWLIVWALVAILAGQKQRVATVDEYGQIHTA